MGENIVEHQWVSEWNANAQWSGELSDDQFAWLKYHRLAALLPAFRGRADLVRNAIAQHMRATFALRDLLYEGGKLKVHFVAFKGLGFAFQSNVYATPELRALGDLDLWVASDHLDAAIEAAIACGYTRVYHVPDIRDYEVREGHQVALVHPMAGLLELHHRLWHELDDEIADTLFQRAQPHAEYENLRVLHQVDLVLVSALHWMRSSRVFWGWLLEIVRLLEQLTACERARLANLARRLGLQPILLYPLQQAYRLWGVDGNWRHDLVQRLNADVGMLLHLTLRDRKGLTTRRGRFLVVEAHRIFRSNYRSVFSLRWWLWPHPGVVCLVFRLNQTPTLCQRLCFVLRRIIRLPFVLMKNLFLEQ